MRFISRKRLNHFLVRSPLLRLLFYDRWFRRAAVGFLALLLFLALFLPRIWTAPNSGNRPGIRVSGLDLAQAWSLKRSAEKSMTAGRFDEANFAWLAAIANSPGDADLRRGLLRNLLKADSSHGALAGHHSFWLLEMTKTNRADLELVAKILEKFGEHQLLADLLAQAGGDLTPPLEASFQKALFNSERFRAFAARSQKRPEIAALDSELPLYGAAYAAGWGAPTAAGDARRKLESVFHPSSAPDPALRALAGRLLLLVFGRRLEADQCQQVLHQLEQSGAATFADHLGYWKVLSRVGRNAEGLALAENPSHPPASAVEIGALAAFLAELGAGDEALRLLNSSVPTCGDWPIFWTVYGEQLIQAGEWEEARRVALQMRARSRVRDALAAFSFFLEGRAEWAMGRTNSAEVAFGRMREWEFRPARLGLSAAKELRQFGCALIARDTLVKLQNELRDDNAYWRLVFQVAADLKDEALMLSASEQARRLRPDDPAVLNDYAAARLVRRERPGDVIQATLQLHLAHPRSTVATVNHAAALLLNRRPDPALAMLNRIRTNELTRAQAAFYELDLFEAHFQLGEFAAAAEIGTRIQLPDLFPSQRRWLDQAKQRMDLAVSP